MTGSLTSVFALIASFSSAVTAAAGAQDQIHNLIAPETPCGDVALDESFDGVIAPSLPMGWIATNAIGGAPLWVTSTTAPDTTPNDAFIAGTQEVSDKRLDTPDIAITSPAAQISFNNFFSFQCCGFDGGVLEVSSPNINGGAFTDITNPAVGGSFVTGGYNVTLSTGSPIAGRMAWGANSGGYVNTVANLGPNVARQSIKLRFRFGSNLGGFGPGWRIDTLRVVDGPCSSPTPSPTCPPVITQSTSQAITSGSYPCQISHPQPGGDVQTDNSYWRAFNTASFFGAGNYFVTSVSFGVSSTNLTQSVFVRLYANNGAAFPGGTRTQIGARAVTVTPAQAGTIVSTPLMAVVPLGTNELVMELFTPASPGIFVVGANTALQTGPSYHSAPCTGSTPVMMSDRIVFNVYGSCATQSRNQAIPPDNYRP